MKNIRVLTVGNDPAVKGGITSVISQILRHDWAGAGVEMHFVPTYIDKNNILKIAYFAAAYRKISRELKNFQPDVVHIHMSYRGSFTRKYQIHKLCKKHGVHDIIHLHGSEFEKWYDGLNEKKQAKVRRLLRECDGFLVLGEKWNAAIKRIEPQTKTIVVSNTIKVPEETVSWNPGKVQVLFLGMLIQRKGVADLLNAVRRLSDAAQLAGAEFVIAGTGPEEENLKRQAEELGIGGIVRFAGWTDGEKKKQLLTESQLLVLPSYNEGLPVAILEAMSYGMPVIATNVGDISAVVQDGKNGFLVAPGDVEALADRIAMLISDEGKYRAFSQEARRKIESEFSDEPYFQTLRQCYESCVEA